MVLVKTISVCLHLCAFDCHVFTFVGVFIIGEIAITANKNVMLTIVLMIWLITK